jgi:hypothetical protein
MASFARRERVIVEQQPMAVQLPTLWKAMILTSFIVNLILLVIIVYLVGFVLQNRGRLGVTTQNIAGNVRELQDVVVQLQRAHIITNIPLNQQLPINLIVPIDTTTTVTTVDPVPINVPADIDMGPFGQLHPNVSLALPAGTALTIKLKLDVPLNTEIPVKLDVPVDIALANTELGPQFERLGAVLNRLLSSVGPTIGVPIPNDVPPVQVPNQTQ